MAKLVSKAYGEALLQIAHEKNKGEQFIEELTRILEVIEENPGFTILMKHPVIPKEDKKRIIKEVFGERIDQDLEGFLVLLITKDRDQDLKEIAKYFFEKMKEINGIGVVHVTSALELTESVKAQIKAKVLETTIYTLLEIDFSIDTELIGGLVIQIGDRVVDGSIKTKLHNLKKELLKIQVS